VNKSFLVLTTVFLLLIPALLPAFGGKEKAGPPPEPLVKLSGVVRLVGNEPFTELVVSNSDDTWYIAREERDKLRDLQHQTVTLEGIETLIELKFANGMPVGQRRELRNIKVISVP